MWHHSHMLLPLGILIVPTLVLFNAWRYRRYWSPTGTMITPYSSLGLMVASLLVWLRVPGHGSPGPVLVVPTLMTPLTARLSGCILGWLTTLAACSLVTFTVEFFRAIRRPTVVARYGSCDCKNDSTQTHALIDVWTRPEEPPYPCGVDFGLPADESSSRSRPRTRSVHPRLRGSGSR